MSVPSDPLLTKKIGNRDSKNLEKRNSSLRTAGITCNSSNRSMMIDLEPPPRKRKSADKMSIVVSVPPWKCPTAGDLFQDFQGKFTCPLDDGNSLDVEENVLFDKPRNMSYYEYQGDCWGFVVVLPCYEGSELSIRELKSLLSPKICLEFQKRRVKVCGFTVNPDRTNQNWLNEALEITRKENESEKESQTSNISMYFSIFSDNSMFDNAVDIGVLNEEETGEQGVPILYRSIFVIRPDKKIAMTMQMGTDVERDFNSILRQIEMIQKSSNVRAGE